MFTAIMLMMLTGGVSGEEPQFSEEVENCLGCHADPDLTMDLPDGPMSVFVDRETFGSSVHGPNLNCSDCHTDITEYPHPEIKFKTRREFSLALYESCKQCHFENYTKTVESIHYQLLSKGDPRAPTCVDCHGAHDITPPAQPRSRISKTCQSCHSEVFKIYATSVHGKALLEDANPDVPSCTDCHQAHDIEDPRTKSFLARTPQLCGKCHSNEEVMKKYGLSTQVVSTYLRDFHGVSTTFYRGQDRDITSWTAACTDCHGVHDIVKVSSENSPVLKANLVRTCSKCHPGATPEFPNAWLSHYEPSPDKAALVYYIKLFYKFFIPFTVIGLLIHIVLHVWRFTINR